MTDFDLDLDAGEVEVNLSELEIQGTTDDVYEVGSTAEYGPFLEFGTRHMPPYPWFRPAIRELQANPRGFLLKNSEFQGINDVDDASQLLLAFAAGLERQMKRNVSAASATNRSPGTDPEHPKVDTGNLRAGIGFRQIR